MDAPAFGPTSCDASHRVAPVVRDRDVGVYATSVDADAERYQVALDDGPGDELAFVRAVRTIARLTLAEALDIHAYATRVPKATIVAGIPFASASQVAVALEIAGIAARLDPSSLATPMVCRPRADEVRTWLAPSTASRAPPRA